MSIAAAGSRAGAIAYWAGAVALVGFGYVAIFSVGAPLFLTGVVMLVVGRWRRRRTVLWPALVGVWAFTLAFVLVAPLWCSSSAAAVARGAVPLVGRTVCGNVLGIDYSGPSPYTPSYVPALLAGLAGAAGGAFLTRSLLGRRGRARAIV